MKAVVTGGYGFIGKNQVKYLLQRKAKVSIIDNLSTSEYDAILSVAVADQYMDDIQNMSLKFASEFFKDVDVVYHYAAIARVQSSFERPEFYYNNNISSTVHLLGLLRDINFKGKFVFTSSSSVYNGVQPGNVYSTETDACFPESPYASSKLICEDIVRMYSKLYGINAAIIRPFNVYGPGMSTKGGYSTVLRIFIDRIVNGEKIDVYGDGNQTRDFTHIYDFVRAAELIAEKSPKDSCETYNVATGKSYSLNDLIKQFQRFHPVDVNYLESKNEPENTLANISKVSALGYDPKCDVLEWIKTVMMSWS